MRLKFNLPDLVLENIRQYVGNCRLYNGELIRTINKNSFQNRRLQLKLESRKRHQFFHAYSPSQLFTKITDIEGPLPNLEEHIPPQYPDGFGEPQNWTHRYFIGDSYEQHDHRFRSISYIYTAESDTLEYHYKRGVSVKLNPEPPSDDPLKKNMNVIQIIN